MVAVIGSDFDFANFANFFQMVLGMHLLGLAMVMQRKSVSSELLGF
jgi:hypothetical protein